MENVLITLALSIGFFHVLVGVDHYLPFIALSKANNWSIVKTTLITLICGFVHVLSSIIIGVLGILFGINVLKLKAIELLRSELASWVLVIFGIFYFIWAIRKLIKEKTNYKETTFLNTKLFSVLFIIFILGPCEPLIPILMFPALASSFNLVVVVTLVFSVITILTMLTIVLAFSYGLSFVPFKTYNKFAHVLASIVIFICGLGVKLFGI